MRLPVFLAGLAAVTGVSFAELPKTAADLFRLDRIWEATFSLTAEEWEGLQPDEPQGGGFPFGGPGGPGGPGRPGGPPGAGGPGGGPQTFGPGNFLAGGFVSALDQDKNGQVSAAEFQGGFARWYGEWDAKKQGSLGGDEVRDGLNKALMGPPPGGGPGGGPRPGGPGGPGGPGFGLQGREGQRNGLSAMRGINFEYVRANLTFEGTAFPEVAVRYKGNGTYMDARDTVKKSLKVDLNEFVKGQKIAGVSKLNFHNNITDVAWMHEPLAYELYRAAGVPAPRTAYARLTLNAAGAHTNKFLGLYSLVENPDSNWAESNFGSRKGAIFKPVTRELFKFQGTNWGAYNQAYDPKTDLTPKQQQRVYDFARLITDADDAELARRLPEFLDVDEFSRFMAVTVWLSSTDSILMMGQNFTVYLHPKTDRFLFMPWDLDRAFGNFFSPSPERMSIQKAWAEDNRFLQRVMAVPAVAEAYRARLQEFQGTLFQP
ncbi:MAG: CotH kinase family protein, partial [Verrucomicrobia bacterium]|nr:CotH kinase family protein [Verrucomicrobiota bacterium]